MLFRFACTLLFAAALQAQDRVPVVLELFTSEGCSSCPAADSLIAKLEREQPVANVDLIVLSEHVDYWNSLGWKDAFSSPVFSKRQQSYAGAQHSDDVYTPQAVIDGHYSSVGSNRENLLKAIAASGDRAKPPFAITVRREGNTIVVVVPPVAKGDIWLALAQSKIVSQVTHGENGGRTLRHTAVVRSLTKVSAGETRLAADKNWDSDLRVIAFVQDSPAGRILQATQKIL